jgi:hypothetical protein
LQNSKFGNICAYDVCVKYRLWHRSVQVMRVFRTWVAGAVSMPLQVFEVAPDPVKTARRGAAIGLHPVAGVSPECRQSVARTSPESAFAAASGADVGVDANGKLAYHSY